MNAAKRIRYFKKLIKFINFYPPYVGAGIKLKYHSPDFTHFKVQMKLRWYNKNLIGTHFGGSLYAMCDPFYVFILVANLGENYIIWDKAASIDFVRPGKGRVEVTFQISPEELRSIKEEVDRKGKGIFSFHTEVVDEENKPVARLDKQVYVRRKVAK